MMDLQFWYMDLQMVLIFGIFWYMEYNEGRFTDIFTKMAIMLKNIFDDKN